MMTNNSNQPPVALSIIELGGYPDFSRLLQSQGYQAIALQSMRKALKYIKNNRVDLIIAEFNFQSDFRDRTSQLESLMASIAQKPGVEVIVFYDKEQSHQLQRLQQNFDFFETFAYPIDEQALSQATIRARN